MPVTVGQITSTIARAHLLSPSRKKTRRARSTRTRSKSISNIIRGVSLSAPWPLPISSRWAMHLTRYCLDLGVQR